MPGCAYADGIPIDVGAQQLELLKLLRPYGIAIVAAFAAMPLPMPGSAYADGIPIDVGAQQLD